MMRKTIIALFAPVAVGLVQPTAASARGGGGGGHGGGFGGGGFHGGGFRGGFAGGGFHSGRRAADVARSVYSQNESYGMGEASPPPP